MMQDSQRSVEYLLSELHCALLAADISLSVEAESLLINYLLLVDKWNKTYNLTAVRSLTAMISQHLVDSLVIMPMVEQYCAHGGAVLDAGCGAGLPGIPLAVAMPSLSVCLVDSNAKKVAFVRQAIIELRLANARATSARLEKWQPPEPFSLIVSRALTSLDKTVQLTSHLLAPGGFWLAMKGRCPQDEIALLPSEVKLRNMVLLNVPGVEGERHLLIVEKTY